jgi:hypothetical protein
MWGAGVSQLDVPFGRRIAVLVPWHLRSTRSLGMGQDFDHPEGALIVTISSQ